MSGVEFKVKKHLIRSSAHTVVIKLGNGKCSEFDVEFGTHGYRLVGEPLEFRSTAQLVAFYTEEFKNTTIIKPE